MAGKLIVFEGVDEVGKTTLATMLAESIRASGGLCKLESFPGNKPGTLGKHVNALHHDLLKFQIGRVDPTSLQLLHIAAHIDAINQEILPALQKDHTVILDRFWWSAWIYGRVNGADEKSMAAGLRAEMIQWRKIRPSRVFLVTRHSPFLKQADMMKWKRIDRLYRGFAAEQKKRFPVTVLRNDSTLASAFEQIRKIVKAA